MSTNEQEVDLEMAHENLARTQEKICEAGGTVAGFRPDAVFYAAEFATIRQMLTAVMCTPAEYVNKINANLSEALSEMVDLGIGDISLLDEDEDYDETVGPE